MPGVSFCSRIYKKSHCSHCCKTSLSSWCFRLWILRSPASILKPFLQTENHWLVINLHLGMPFLCIDALPHKKPHTGGNTFKKSFGDPIFGKCIAGLQSCKICFFRKTFSFLCGQFMRNRSDDSTTNLNLDQLQKGQNKQNLPLWKELSSRTQRRATSSLRGCERKALSQVQQEQERLCINCCRQLLLKK